MSTAFRTTLLTLLRKVYKPIAAWCMTTFATKTELSQNAAEHPHFVDIASLTPSSTFVKNSIVGINGVLYRATAATSNMPCTMVEENGAFVANIINGKKCFVVRDATPNAGWEIYTDAAVEYWIASVNQSLDGKQATISDLATIRSNASAAIKTNTTYTVGGVTYTANDLLEAMASLMPKRLVTEN